MTIPDQLPLPDDAQLARLSDALDARVEGRPHRVPGTVEPDAEWLAALVDARVALRADYPDLAPSAAQRDAAIATARAVHAAGSASGGAEAIAALVGDASPAHTPAAHESDDAGTTTVIRPPRWQRPAAVISAAAAALLVVAVAALPRVGDNDVSFDSAIETEEADSAGGAAEAVPGEAKVADSATPTPSAAAAAANTIAAIVGPASAPLVIDSVEALLELAASFSASAGPAGTDSPVSMQASGVPGMEVAGFDCPLGPSETTLAEVSWQGTMGVAVLDTVTGVVRVLDMACAELVVAP